MSSESEWQTRKRRIDPRLDAAGWNLTPGGSTDHRAEEFPTENGPADYTLHLNGHVVAIVEAKKVAVGPQEVLTQAERYARGLAASPYNFEGLRVPFLYATNGEVIWFRDVRHRLSRSRQVTGFHTPNALKEMLAADFDGACETLLTTEDLQPMMRPYQRDANAAVEKAIAERKRRMLVAMATGTGKTYTLVNQVYRLMKAGVAKRILFLVGAAPSASAARSAGSSGSRSLSLCLVAKATYQRARTQYRSRTHRGESPPLISPCFRHLKPPWRPPDQNPQWHAAGCGRVARTARSSQPYSPLRFVASSPRRSRT